MRTLADLQRLVTDYEIVSSGAWDDATREREADLQRNGRTYKGLAVQITELVINAGVHRGEALR
jgi:hypothetical protein